MSWFKSLKSSFVVTVARWQDQRFLWIFMAVVMICFVLLAQIFFQSYLYMKPCEQCVYIRFAMLVIALGGLISSINPKNLVCKISGYILAFYGAVIGIGYSQKLHKFHKAVHSDDPLAIFGVQGCSLSPSYPFHLPLDKVAPKWFLPTGECGYDAPIVPEEAKLDVVQSFFIDLYTQGWYLIPQFKFMDMSLCTLLVFVVTLVLLFVMIVCMFLVLFRDKLAKFH
ncbi:MAG: protein-disulfide oxidoreductase DsbI [Campylobacter sp.]|nr:protein-disulfide oxidoreductase DsbI [Campylobacter sp.]